MGPKTSEKSKSSSGTVGVEEDRIETVSLLLRLMAKREFKFFFF